MDYQMNNPMELPIEQQIGPLIDILIPKCPQNGPQMGPPMVPQHGPQIGHQIAPQNGPQIGPQNRPQMGPQRAPQMAPQRAPQMAPQRAPQMAPQNEPQMSAQRQAPPVIWNETTTLKFVKKLEAYPCLWNRRSKNFTNASSKAAALYKLSRHMNLPGCGAEFMQQKVLELKAAFTREKRRMFDVRKDGGEFIPRFQWYKVADNFWGKIIRIRRQSYSDDDGENFITSSVPGDSSPPPTPNTDSVNNTANPTRPVNPTTSNNEFDAFGKCVALQLKKMPPVEAYELHAEIQAIISKKKLKTLNRTRTQCSPCNESASNPLYNITAPTDKCGYTDLRMPFHSPYSHVPWNEPGPRAQYNSPYSNVPLNEPGPRAQYNAPRPRSRYYDPGPAPQYNGPSITAIIPSAGLAYNISGSNEPVIFLRTGQPAYDGYR